MKQVFLLVAVSLLLFNCEKDNVPDQIKDVEFVEIAQGKLNGSGDFSKSEIIVTKTADWEDFKIRMHDIMVGNNFDFSQTEIDFDTYQIIAVIDKIYGNLGHSIDVISVKENSKNIIVNIDNLNTIGTPSSALSQPYHIVRITKTDKEIVFEYVNKEQL